MLIFYDGANFVEIPDYKEPEAKKELFTMPERNFPSEGISITQWSIKEVYYKAPSEKEVENKSILSRLLKFIGLKKS